MQTPPLEVSHLGVEFPRRRGTLVALADVPRSRPAEILVACHAVEGLRI